jgi:fatty-acyl-CoA synthase
MNLCDVISSHHQTAPLTFETRTGETVTSRSELLDKATIFAAELGEKNVVPGDTVAILADTSAFLLIAMVGAWKAGVSTTVLPTPTMQFDLHWWGGRWCKMLEACKANAIVLGEAYLVKFDSAVATQSFSPIARIIEGEALSAKLLTEEHLISPVDIYHKQFTSGTTGEPQIVEISHRQIIQNVSECGERLRINRGDKFLSWLPFYHDMGFIFSLCGPLVWNIPLVLVETQLFSRNPAVWLRLLTKHQATITVAPPSTYENVGNFLPKNRTAKLNLESVRIAALGAEPIYARSLEAFSSTFNSIGFEKKAFTTGYGLAEATLCVTVAAPGDELIFHTLENRETLVGCGYPLASVSLLTGNDAGLSGAMLQQELEAEILIRGPTMAGAFCNSEGWLETGDLGFVRNDILFVTGRKKELIIVNGQNFSPVWVEDIARAYISITEDRKRVSCAAFQSASGRVRLVYETKCADTGIEKALSKVIQSKLGISLDARGVARNSIPFTTSGKLARRACDNKFHNEF